MTTQEEVKEFPLFPDLPEPAAEEAVKLIESFKAEIAKAGERCVRDFYCDILPFIETDAWSNFRQALLDALCDYKNRHSNKYDFKKIREAIYKQFREEIIEDLNADLVKEVEELKQRLATAHSIAL